MRRSRYVASAVAVRLIGHQPRPPAVFIIYALLLIVMIIGWRASFRVIGEFVAHRRHGGERVVIYSATDGGDVAVREMLNDPGSRYRIVGFVDDDKLSHHSRFHGYPSLAGRNYFRQ